MKHRKPFVEVRGVILREEKTYTLKEFIEDEEKHKQVLLRASILGAFDQTVNHILYKIRAIVEAIYWQYGMRQPDKGGVDFWTEEYKREAEKAKWLGRILEGLRNEKVNQKPEGLRYLDAKENRWRTEKDVIGK